MISPEMFVLVYAGSEPTSNPTHSNVGKRLTIRIRWWISGSLVWACRRQGSKRYRL
jgi:hypothetical protein